MIRSYQFSLFIVFILFAFSCETPSPSRDSAEVLVEEVLMHVKSKNLEGLYSECYASSKDQIRAMLVELNGKVADEKVDIVHENVINEKPKMLRAFNAMELLEFTPVLVDSINVEHKKKPGDIDLSEGYKLGFVIAHVNTGSKRFKIQMSCMDLNTGSWKMVRHAMVEELK